MKHGKGEYRWSSGNRYNGDYFDDKPHGTGIYNTVHGDSYVGDFVHGKFEGMLEKKFRDIGFLFSFCFHEISSFQEKAV